MSAAGRNGRRTPALSTTFAVKMVKHGALPADSPFSADVLGSYLTGSLVRVVKRVTGSTVIAINAVKRVACYTELSANLV